MENTQPFVHDAESKRKALKLLRTDPVKYFEQTSRRQPFGFTKKDSSKQ